MDLIVDLIKDSKCPILRNAKCSQNVCLPTQHTDLSCKISCRPLNFKINSTTGCTMCVEEAELSNFPEWSVGTIPHSYWMKRNSQITLLPLRDKAT